MRVVGVEVVARCRPRIAGMAQNVEEALVQQFILHPSMVRFCEPVLHRLSRRDVMPCDLAILLPLQDRIARQLRPDVSVHNEGATPHFSDPANALATRMPDSAVSTTATKRSGCGTDSCRTGCRTSSRGSAAGQNDHGEGPDFGAGLLSAGWASALWSLRSAFGQYICGLRGLPVCRRDTVSSGSRISPRAAAEDAVAAGRSVAVATMVPSGGSAVQRPPIALVVVDTCQSAGPPLPVSLSRVIAQSMPLGRAPSLKRFPRHSPRCRDVHHLFGQQIFELCVLLRHCARTDGASASFQHLRPSGIRHPCS